MFEEGGVLVLFGDMLLDVGFEVMCMDCVEVSNLVVWWGEKVYIKIFGFNGYIDVVFVGDEVVWMVDFFGVEIKDGIMYGCGVMDMKLGVVVFVVVVIDLVKDMLLDGVILIVVIGDEEGFV